MAEAEARGMSALPPTAALPTADDLFDKIDGNHDGSLCVAEVGAALRAARLPTRSSDVAALFRRMDADGDGTVTREEFRAFVARRRANLRAAFDGICGGGERRKQQQQEQPSGSKRQHFTAGSLRAAAAAAHLTLSDTDVRLIMQRMDANGDDVVTFDEFVSCMLLVPAVNPRAFFDSWFVDCFCDDALSEYTVTRELRAPVRPMLAPAPLTKQPSPAPPTSSSSTTPAAPAAPLEEEEEEEEEVAAPSFAAMVAKKLVCGGVAGIVSRTATAPIDRVRLRMMAAATPLPMVAACRGAVSGGVRALWTGNGVNCLKIGPEMGIKLLSFDVLRKAFAADPDNVTAAERFAAGGAAGALSQTAIYPLEVLRTRLVTAAAGRYTGVRHCARELSRSGGVRAFYAGLAPSVLGIVPYAAIDLTLNSMLRECAASRLDARGQEVSVPLLLGCGMASSTAATVATFPLNVVRTKAQATGAPLGVIVQEMRKDGPRSLCRGFAPCMVKVLPATSISYTVYECLGRQWGS